YPCVATGSDTRFKKLVVAGCRMVTSDERQTGLVLKQFPPEVKSHRVVDRGDVQQEARRVLDFYLYPLRVLLHPWNLGCHLPPECVQGTRHLVRRRRCARLLEEYEQQEHVVVFGEPLWRCSAFDGFAYDPRGRALDVAKGRFNSDLLVEVVLARLRLD